MRECCSRDSHPNRVAGRLVVLTIFAKDSVRVLEHVGSRKNRQRMLMMAGGSKT